MRILRNYILKECILPFFLALGVLTCVFLLGNLVKLTHMVINKGVSLLTMGKIFILYIPVLLNYTLPIACIVGVLLAFGRLSADNEIIAIRASGIHLKKILIPLTIAGILLSLGSFLINDRVIPYAYHSQRTMLKNLGTQNPAALLEPGVFINSFDKEILFIHKIEGNKLYSITIYQPQPDGKPTRTIIASRGEFTPVPGKDQIILKLIDGTSDEQDLENPNNFYKLRFDKLFVTISLSKGKQEVDKKPKSMTLKELSEQRKKLEKFLVETAPLKTEFHKRISWSFAILIFVLIGFPLAIVTNRREKTANVLFAIITAAAYYLLSLGCEHLGAQNIAPAIIMWLPNIIGFGVVILLNYKLLKL